MIRPKQDVAGFDVICLNNRHCLKAMTGIALPLKKKLTFGISTF